MSTVPPGHVRRRVIVEETRALPLDSDSRNPEHDQQSGIDSSLSVVHPSAAGHPQVHSVSSEQLDSDTELKHDDQSSDTATNVGPSSEPRPVQAAGTRTKRPPATDSRPSGRTQKFDFPTTTESLTEPQPSTSTGVRHRKQRTAFSPAEQSAACAFPSEREPAERGAPFDFTSTNNGKGY